MKTRIGLVRVLTTADEEVLRSHGRLLESRFPEFQVESRCIEDQPEGIHDEETCAIAVPKILNLGREMEREGVKAIIVSCADDPGVEDLRKVVAIPVIGAGSSSACLALSFGSRVGTLGITESTPLAMQRVLGKHLVAHTRPKGVETTLDLMTDDGKKNAMGAIEYLKKSGAHIVALACTGYSTIGIARELERAGGLPVIDAVLAAGLFAWHITRDR
jgi:allantoin racemase